jgi:hypothetical protein
VRHSGVELGQIRTLGEVYRQSRSAIISWSYGMKVSRAGRGRPAGRAFAARDRAVARSMDQDRPEVVNGPVEWQEVLGWLVLK